MASIENIKHWEEVREKIKWLKETWKKNKEIAEILGIGERQVYTHLAKMKERFAGVGKTLEDTEKQEVVQQTKQELELLKIVAGFTPTELKQLLKQAQIEEKKQIDEIIWKEWEIKLGIVSDTHLNNKLCDIDSLHRFYEDANNEWVDAFVHAGDLTDWINTYPWQVYELLNLSFEDQLKYVESNYPKVDGKKTYFISWNHDEQWLKQGWINFGNAISKLRDDMIHLGFYNAKIHLNWFTVELQHWWWSSPYAVSYHMQKYMERIPQNEPIDLYILWHYHRELFMMYRWALAMLPWAFLKENLLAKRFKLGNNIAAWILQMKRDKTWKIEYIPHLHKYH